jgi:hypothetical protein
VRSPVSCPHCPCGVVAAPQRPCCNVPHRQAEQRTPHGEKEWWVRMRFGVCVYRGREMEREESNDALRMMRQPACMHDSLVCVCCVHGYALLCLCSAGACVCSMRRLHVCLCTVCMCLSVSMSVCLCLFLCMCVCVCNCVPCLVCMYLCHEPCIAERQGGV